MNRRIPALLLIPFALGAMSLSVRADETTSRVEFLRDVVPALTKAGCNAGKCHGSFQGRGGFRLSLLGFSPTDDYDALVTEARGRRIAPTSPLTSLLLTKPLGLVPHGGGRRFSETDTAFAKLRDWIAQGAAAPVDPKLHVARIEVTPTDIVLDPASKQALEVRAHWSDGNVRDVTRWATYEVREERYAEVDADGVITAGEAGRTAVTISYMGQVAAVTVTIPFADKAVAFEFPESNFIDRILVDEWKKLGLKPAERCDDYEFLRRVYLDIIGTLPTPDEVRRFATSTDANKRNAAIDALLQRPEYVDYWATKWADLLRVHRRYVGEKGLWTFWGWVRAAIRENRPVDEITRELLTSRGSLFTNGATAFYYVDTKPHELAETTSQLFLGIRLTCARCHHHPYEVWSQEDYYGLANCFTRLELKDNGDAGKFGGARLLRPISTASRERRVAMKVSPRVMGFEIDPESTDDVRKPLAAWITAKENPYFTRNFVNRYWAYMMGRGLVEPIDDMRATNPPSIPALLNALNADFVEHGNDLRHLIRTICRSRAYQLASEATPQRDADGMFYTHRSFRRLPAAVMLDAVNQAAETSETFAGLPAKTRAISLPDPAIASYFLTAFGRSLRNSPCECATSSRPDLAQALHLINSTAIDTKIGAANGRVARLLKEATSDAKIVDDLYYATLSRPPSVSERKQSLALVAEAPSKKEGFEDLLWTLLNSTEFVFNH